MSLDRPMADLATIVDPALPIESDREAAINLGRTASPNRPATTGAPNSPQYYNAADADPVNSFTISTAEGRAAHVVDPAPASDPPTPMTTPQPHPVQREEIPLPVDQQLDG